jgi:hypothetical protein
MKKIFIGLLLLGSVSFGATPIKDLVLQGNANANTNRIVNLGTPVNSNDAATKDYVDTHGGGGGGSGTVTSIVASSPLTGGTITNTGTIGIQQSSGSQSGYLSSTDWSTFNNKLATNGNGTGLTNLNASNLASGTVSTSRLPSSLLYTNSTEATNARTPLSHVHAESDITGLTNDLASKAGTNTFTDVASGLVPPSGGGTTKFLRADGTWVIAGGGGGGDMYAANNLSDLADKAVSRTNLGVAIGVNVQAYSTNLTTLSTNNGGSLTNLSSSALQGTVATNNLPSSLLYTNSLEATNARTPVTHSHAESDVTNLTNDLASKAGTNVFTTALNGLVPLSGVDTNKFLRGDGTWQSVSSGSGDMMASNNLSDLLDKAVSRTNLGVAIGVNVQAYNANLTTLAGNNGSGLTNLNGSNIASGIVSASYLPISIVYTNSAEATNARTPTAHTHAESDVTNLTTDLAGKASTNVFSTSANGLVPSSSTNTNLFLRGDGTWQAASGGASWTSVPATTNSAGTAGQMAYSTNGYLYICIGTSNWVRAGLGRW